jgi:hypothetical protein
MLTGRNLLWMSVKCKGNLVVGRLSLTDEWRAGCAERVQVRFGEGSGETCGALGEPKLVTANATRSAPTLPRNPAIELNQFDW